MPVETITEKSVLAHVDAVWNGYVRKRFATKAIAALNGPAAHDLYVRIKGNRRILPKDRHNEFVSGFGEGQFVGSVVYSALRTHYGD